ncbi:unnamed protein product [Paramecium primaurelia]|uniref:Uncharacterized protein n=1 Tax=Paramecium primaurelia TaxID=5886 RepID=A0A8S1NEM5_PARPR|nr:unnamed protein product [Paramecium primaurelia]
MSQSPIVFTNKPSKPYPLDDSVWRWGSVLPKLHQKDLSPQIKSEPHYFKNNQLEDSQTINNYTVRSVVLPEEPEYIEVDWNAFQLISFD